MKPINSKVLKALAVEVIRLLWDQGLYRDNEILKMCHDNWFSFWVDWRTSLAMEDVDRQVEELNPDPVQFNEPIYWEEEHGETPLGGAMGISHDFTDHDT